LRGQQRRKGAGISAAREQLVAVDEVEERHWLLAQRVDHVMVVNDMATLVAALWRSAALQGEELGRTEEAVEPVVIEVNVQAMADQTRRHAVEDAPQDEAAARSDAHARLLVIGGSPVGERLERWALDVDALALPGIAAADHFVDKAPIGGKLGKVT